MWQQQELRLTPRERGFHLITDEVMAGLPWLAGVATGLLYLQLLPIFGVVTSFEYRLHEVVDILGGPTFYPLEAEAIRGYRALDRRGAGGGARHHPRSAAAVRPRAVARSAGGRGGAGQHLFRLNQNIAPARET